MGIHGLKPLLKKLDKSIFHQNHYSEFRGKTLTMDVSIFLHKYVHTDRRHWFANMVNMMCKMRKGGVNIIAVFDGKHVPVEKYLERQNRKVTTQKTKDRMLQIAQMQELLYTNCVNEFGDNKPVSDNYIDRICTLLRIDKDDPLVPFNLTDPEDCIKALSEKEDKIANQIESVGPHHTEQTQRLCDVLGIPRLTAYGEAEALCGSLAYHKMVDGVLSRDTDTLCYLCPLFVCEFNDNMFEWTTLQEVLDTLNFDIPKFIDLCIMCGCDYNKNISRVGPMTAYKKLDEYGSIEEFAIKEDKDTTCLRFKRCRELFKPYSKEYLLTNFKVPFKKDIDREELVELFAVNNCRIGVDYVEKIFNTKSEVELFD